MSKVNLKKELKHLYSASAKKPAIVHVPETITPVSYPIRST